MSKDYATDPRLDIVTDAIDKIITDYKKMGKVPIIGIVAWAVLEALDNAKIEEQVHV